MHYYQFNIGDYARRTKYLDLLEDLAYRRLLDLYYLNEEPFTESAEELSRAIGMRSHCEEVAYILQTFFPDGHNKHADAEIDKVNTKSAKAKASAEARWNKGSMRSHSDSNATQDPIPNTQDKKNSAKSRSASARFEEFWAVYPVKKNKKKSLEIWKRKNLDSECDDLICDLTHRIARDRAWIDGFIPLPSTYLNGERWEDAIDESPPKKTGFKQPEAVGSVSHKDADQIQAEADERELRVAQNAGFKTVDEYNAHLFNQQMARLGK